MSNEIPESIHLWIIKFSRKNYWRVAAWMEIEDFIQDGLVAAIKCRNKYGDEIEPKHFMSLVKTAVYRNMMDYVRNKMERHENFVTHIADLNSQRTESQILDVLQIPQDSIAELSAYIAELPEYIRKAISLLSTDEGAKLLRNIRVRLNQKSETYEDRLKRLADVPDNVSDLESEFLAYFSS